MADVLAFIWVENVPWKTEKNKNKDPSVSEKERKMAKQDAEMKEASQKNDTESEEPQAEVSKEEKERLVLEGESKSGVLRFDIEVVLTDRSMW